MNKPLYVMVQETKDIVRRAYRSRMERGLKTSSDKFKEITDKAMSRVGVPENERPYVKRAVLSHFGQRPKKRTPKKPTPVKVRITPLMRREAEVAERRYQAMLPDFF